MITATSPIPTCCRSNSTTLFWKNVVRACPNCPTLSAIVMRRRSACPYNANILTAEAETARWFEALLGECEAKQGKTGPDVARQAANWLTSELFGALNRLGKSLEDSPVTPAQAAELLALVADGTISGTISKQVFEKMLETGDGAGAIIEREGLKQTSDTGAIEAAVAKVLAGNADKVAQYRSGKEALFGFFIGQTMKAMQGKANPQVVNEAVRKGLAG